jgi:hypothetical protein
VSRRIRPQFGRSYFDYGSAWIFTRSGNIWTQQAKLVGTGVVGSFAAQGSSVFLSGDGNTAIVGGPYDNFDGTTYNCNPCGGVGAAWVFTRSGDVWGQQAKLVGTGSIGYSLEGISVSLSGNGSIALVGGPWDNKYAGAAWVYTQPVFAGTPGKANCDGKSVSALAEEYGGLNNAAASGARECACDP